MTTRKKKPAPKQAAKKKRKPGTPAVGSVIERQLKGKTYRLRITAEGCVLGKKTYTSLTSAAKAVTAYQSISGPRFWLGTPTEKGGAK